MQSDPALWLMLFAPEDLRTGEERDDDGQAETYVCFVSEKGAALQRARTRLPLVIDVIGAERGPLLEAWLTYLQTHAKAYVWWDPFEYLWMGDDDQEFANEHLEKLQAFDQSPWEMKGFIWKRRQLTSAWCELLGIIDPESGKSFAYEVLGYPAIEPAPWNGDQKV